MCVLCRDSQLQQGYKSLQDILFVYRHSKHLIGSSEQQLIKKTVALSMPISQTT